MVSIPQDERQPRILPVLMLADGSGSMDVDGKIDAENAAIDQLGPELAAFKAGHPHVDVRIQVISFAGNSATPVLSDWVAPESLAWHPLTAGGRTPMGAAFDEARRQFDRLGANASRYPAVMCLVSDGLATDEWVGPLARLQSSPYGQTATCISVAIGSDADRDLLGKFCERSEMGILEPQNASQLIDAIVLSIVHASQAAVTRKSMASSPHGNNPQSVHSIAIGDLPEGSLTGSIVDDASLENNLW